MENDIWNEISSFLNQLRCENINRENNVFGISMFVYLHELSVLP